ncbi:hypothetical protein [Pseudoalteromonas phage vB_PtuP_Slicky01]|nr:hypothetical protein [Pseudoalteromonas phage vB_PtuP_Slicky01]
MLRSYNLPQIGVVLLEMGTIIDPVVHLRRYNLVGIVYSDDTVEVLKDRRCGMLGYHDNNSWSELAHEYCTRYFRGE